MRIALVEKEKVGGTCLHRGCIPAKELLETAAVYRTVKGAKEYGIDVDGWTVDFSATQVRKNKVIDQLHKGLQGLLKRRKVVTFAGSGKLLPGRVVQVEGLDGGTTELTAPAVILAAGSVPRTIPGFEVDGRFVLTSDEVLELERLPETAVVIGGGAIEMCIRDSTRRNRASRTGGGPHGRARGELGTGEGTGSRRRGGQGPRAQTGERVNSLGS